MFRAFVQSISTRLTLALLLISLVPLGLLMYLYYQDRQTILVEHAHQQLLLAGKQCADEIDTFVEQNRDAIKTESRSPMLVAYLSLPSLQRSGSREERMATEVLDEFHSKNRAFIQSYMLLDMQGNVVLDSEDALIGVNQRHRAYYQEPVAHELEYISPLQFAEQSRKAALYFSSPVKNTAGEVIGVLAVQYDAAILQHLIVRSQDIANNGSVAVLLDEHYIRLADGARPELNFQPVVPLDPAEHANLLAQHRLPTEATVAPGVQAYEEGLTGVITRTFTLTHMTTTEGDNYILAFVRLKTQPWAIVFIQSRETFMASIERHNREIVLLTIFIAASVVMSAFVMGRLLAGPLVRLTAVAERLSAGDLSARARVESRGELGRLATTFNSMAVQLQELISGLESQVAARTAELVETNGQLRQEITERKAIEAQLLNNQDELRRLATTDGLTELYNRRHFFELGEKAVSQARSDNYSVAAIMLDIDFFKRINDSFGHSCGDQVLTIVAQRCRKEMRNSDIIARYGGEEFAILLPRTDLPTAREIAERLRVHVGQTPIRVERGMLTAVTISLGVAADTGDKLDLEDLLDRADTALFVAKRQGRNQVSSDDGKPDHDLIDEAVSL